MSARTTRAAAVAVLVGFSLAIAAPAAADIVDNGAPGLLTIEVEPGTISLELSPGDRGDWLLTPRLDADSSSELELRVESEGDLAAHLAGLHMSIDECSAAWIPGPTSNAAATCPGTATQLFPSTAVAAIAVGDRFDFGELATGSQRYLRVVFELPDGAPDELQGTDARVLLGFAVAGDSVTVDNGTPGAPGSGSIAQTGAAIALPLGIAAALGVGGAVLRVLARREPQESTS